LLNLIDDFSSVPEGPGSIGDLRREMKRWRWEGRRRREGKREEEVISMELSERSRWKVRKEERTSGIFRPSLRVMVVKGIFLALFLKSWMGEKGGGRWRKGKRREHGEAWLVSDLSDEVEG